MSGRKGLIWHQLILFGVLLLMTGSRLLLGRWVFSAQIFWWWLGAIIGFIFIYFDQLYYAFWQHPEEVLSIKMKDLLGRGRFFEGMVVILEERLGIERLTMRSVLFLATWVVLGVFTVTSVGAPFGRGFMLGLGLHLTFDLLIDYFGRGRDMRLWFWQIKREMLVNEVVGVVWGWVIIFVLLALYL